MLIPELSARLQELDSTSELCHDDIFDILCEEFHLDSEYIEATLTCKCPYALVGFVEAETLEIEDGRCRTDTLIGIGFIALLNA